jgi:hypothetical protein
VKHKYTLEWHLPLTTMPTCMFKLLKDSSNAEVVTFVCLYPSEQVFSHSADVTFTDDRIADFDLCLACLALSSEGSFTCHTFCDIKARVIQSHTKGRSPRPTA